MMPSVNIQFHILLEELTDFVSEVSARHNLEIELERHYPKSVKQVPLGDDLTEEIKQFGHVDRFWLLFKTPGSRKAERFMLNFGGLRGNRLAQSQFGAGTHNPDAYRILKQVAADLKERTTAGMWVVTEAGTVGYVKKARISEGATRASRSDKLELVSPIFTQSFRVDPPEGKHS
jgi:hypothetical protein